jgi:hypothetical protein
MQKNSEMWSTVCVTTKIRIISIMKYLFPVLCILALIVGATDLTFYMFDMYETPTDSRERVVPAYVIMAVILLVLHWRGRNEVGVGQHWEL